MARGAAGFQRVRAPAPAGVVARVIARLIDGLVVTVPVGIVLGILNLVLPRVAAGDDEAVVLAFHEWIGFGSSRWVGAGVLATVAFLYFVWLEAWQGATVGKRLVGARVVRAGGGTLGGDGGRAGVLAGAARNAWLLLAAIPFAGTLLLLAAAAGLILSISSSPDRRGLHDLLARTAVER